MYPGGCEVLGVCHVKDRKDSEFGHSEPLSFPNKSCFWVPHGGLGLLLSEVFLKQRWRFLSKTSMRRSHPLWYQCHITDHIFTSCNVHICACISFCTNYMPKTNRNTSVCVWCVCVNTHTLVSKSSCSNYPRGSSVALPPKRGAVPGRPRGHCQFFELKPKTPSILMGFP